MPLAMNLKKEILASQIALKRTQNNEKQLEKELNRFFKKLKKEVLSSLEEYWSDYQLLQGHINLICSPVHEAHREYYEILEKYVKREYKLGEAEAKRTVNRMGIRYAFKDKIEMPISGVIKKDTLFGTNPEAEQRLLNNTFTASENTMNRVDGQINQILTDGYRSGKGINDISNQLTKRFDQLSSWESKRIARTEVHNSHNAAVKDTYEDLGVEYIQWIAAGDDRVRDSHDEIDGEIVALGDAFSNGLQYPGDTSGDIEEWINCRCSAAPFVIPFGYSAPPFSPFREDDLVSLTQADTDRKPQLTFEELETPEQVADYYGLEYTSELDKKGNIKSYNFKDETHNCEIIIGKNYIKEGNNLIDITNSGNAKYDLKDVIKYYAESPSLLKYATNEISFVNSRAKSSGLAYLVEYNQKKINISDLNKPAKGMEVVRTKFIKINPKAFEAGQTENGNLRHVILHEMNHCLDYSYISKEKADIILNPSKYTYAEVRKANKDIEYYYGISGIANRMDKPSTARADVKYQRENNLPVSPNASKYGGKNSAENWAETGAMSSYYQINDKSMGVIKMSDKEVIGWKEWVNRNPNKYEEAVNILKYGKPSQFTFR